MVKLIHDYVVDANTYDYALMVDKHRVDKKGKPVYEVVGYYSTVAAAICAAKEDCIRKTLGADTYTLDKAIDTMKEINAEFMELLRSTT